MTGTKAYDYKAITTYTVTNNYKAKMPIFYLGERGNKGHSC